MCCAERRLGGWISIRLCPSGPLEAEAEEAEEEEATMSVVV